MKKYISKFHYITQDMPGRSHVQQVQIACNAGANWVQYHCMSKPEDELIDEINEIAEICDDWGATLIIANHYDLIDRVDAQGVHIDDIDADLPTIRKVIGPDKTLGTSITNTGELLKLKDFNVIDYFTLGTSVAGGIDYTINGTDYARLGEFSTDTPLIATGSIQPNEVERLLQTGVDGIAVSSVINLAADPGEKVKEFYRLLY
jgi:thiamine-phosphate pyrophosphorylase